MSVFLSSYNSTERPAKRSKKESEQDDTAVSDSLADFIEERLINDLLVVAVGRMVDWQGLFENLNNLVTRMLSIASNDWRKWRDEIVPALTTLSLFNRFKDSVAKIIWLQLRRTLTETHFESLEVIGLLFDLAAVLGEHLVDNVSEASWDLRRWMPCSRPMDLSALMPLDSSSWTPTVHSVLTRAAALHRLSRITIEETDLETIALLLASWRVRAESSAERLIQDIVYRDLCPVLPQAVLAALQRARFTAISFKIGTSLIKICRHHAPRATLDKTVNLLGSVVCERLPVSLNYSDFMNPEICFEAGFDEALTADNRKDLIRSVLHRILTSVFMDETQDGRKVPIFVHEGLGLAFGRAIGLALRHDVDIRGLRLSSGFVHMLHPRFRIDNSALDDFGIFFPERDPDFMPNWEAVHMLLHGVEEALGPGGLGLFEIDDWVKNRFGASLDFF